MEGTVMSANDLWKRGSELSVWGGGVLRRTLVSFTFLVGCASVMIFLAVMDTTDVWFVSLRGRRGRKRRNMVAAVGWQIFQRIAVILRLTLRSARNQALLNATWQNNTGTVLFMMIDDNAKCESVL